MQILCPTVGNYYLGKVSYFSATVNVVYHACIDTTNTETKNHKICGVIREYLLSNAWVILLARIHVFTLPIHIQDGETFPYVFLHQKFRGCSSFLEKKKLNTKKKRMSFFLFVFKWFYAEGNMVHGRNLTGWNGLVRFGLLLWLQSRTKNSCL